MFVRSIVGALGATRYLISGVVALIVVVYSVLSMLDILPLYTRLADQIGLSTPLLLALLYLVVAAIATIIYYLQLVRPPVVMRVSSSWRAIYRQTDRSGVVWLDLGILAAAVAVGVLARRVFTIPYLIDAVVFLAIVVGFPIAIDLLPTQAPRRALAPQHGRTLREIAERLAPDPLRVPEVVRALYDYNDTILHRNDCYGVDDDTLSPTYDPAMPLEDRPLRHGIVIEIPPRLY